jgi:hypothetical protein
MDISGDKCKVISIKELFYHLVVLIAVSGHLSVGVCMIGLTLVAVVVVEIWGELSPPTVKFALFFSLGDVEVGITLWEVVQCLCNFNRC